MKKDFYIYASDRALVDIIKKENNNMLLVEFLISTDTSCSLPTTAYISNFVSSYEEEIKKNGVELKFKIYKKINDNFLLEIINDSNYIIKVNKKLFDKIEGEYVYITLPQNLNLALSDKKGGFHISKNVRAFELKI